MRKYILFFCLLQCFVSAIAQTNSDWAIASYKNGSIYLGQKLSERDGLIKLRLPTSDTITVNRFTGATIYDSNNAVVFSDGKFFLTKGYFWSTNFGFSVNRGETAHLDLLFGQHINPKLDLAIGFGSEFNESRVAGFSFDSQVITLFGYGRYYITSMKPRVFAFAKLGYGFAADESTEGIPREHFGGINAKYGLGVQFASRNKSKFQLTLGHYFQKTSGQESFLDLIGNEIETEFDILIKRLVVTFGWDF